MSENSGGFWGKIEGIPVIGKGVGVLRSFVSSEANIRVGIAVGESMLTPLHDAVSAFGEINEGISKYTKNFGLAGDEVMEVTSKFNKLVYDSKIARFDVDAMKLLELQEKYSDEIGGRRVNLDIENTTKLSALYSTFNKDAEKTAKFTGELNKFGVSITESDKYASRLYKTAGEVGLSFEKMSKNLIENLKLAQKYTFTDGIEGLERMVKKSMEVNLNIGEASKVAESIATGGFEKATEIGARLQVLGGNFAQISDPLNLLYMGITDMESLQDSIIKVTENMAYFNESTGTMEMSATNRLMLRNAASSMGVSYDELLNASFRGGIREHIGESLAGSGIDDKTKELLMNVGEIRKDEYGQFKAGAVIGGDWYDADEISKNDDLINQLKAQGQSDSENIVDIATISRGIFDLEKSRSKTFNALDIILGQNLHDRYKNFLDNEDGSEVGFKYMSNLIRMFKKAESIPNITGYYKRFNKMSPEDAAKATGRLLYNEELNPEGLSGKRAEASDYIREFFIDNSKSTKRYGGLISSYRNGGEIESYRGGSDTSIYSRASLYPASLYNEVGNLFGLNKGIDQGLDGTHVIVNTGETIVNDTASTMYPKTLMAMNDGGYIFDVINALGSDISSLNISNGSEIYPSYANSESFVSPVYGNSYNDSSPGGMDISIPPIDININIGGNIGLGLPDGNNINGLFNLGELGQQLYYSDSFKQSIVRIVQEQIIQQVTGLNLQINRI